MISTYMYYQYIHVQSGTVQIVLILIYSELKGHDTRCI